MRLMEPYLGTFGFLLDKDDTETRPGSNIGGVTLLGSLLIPVANLVDRLSLLVFLGGVCLNMNSGNPSISW